MFADGGMVRFGGSRAVRGAGGRAGHLGGCAVLEGT